MSLFAAHPFRSCRSKISFKQIKLKFNPESGFSESTAWPQPFMIRIGIGRIVCAGVYLRLLRVHLTTLTTHDFKGLSLDFNNVFDGLSDKPWKLKPGFINRVLVEVIFEASKCL